MEFTRASTAWKNNMDWFNIIFIIFHLIFEPYMNNIKYWIQLNHVCFEFKEFIISFISSFGNISRINLTVEVFFVSSST